MALAIFEKQWLPKPSAMRTVADRRFEDAPARRQTNSNSRANGVVYLSGFVVEILLKALLVERFPAIAKMRPHQLKSHDAEVCSLVWRKHDLEAILLHLKNPEDALRIEFERVSRTRLRFAVSTKRFEKVSGLKRQDRIWNFPSEAVQESVKHDITLIYAYAPSELVDA